MHTNRWWIAIAATALLFVAGQAQAQTPEEQPPIDDDPPPVEEAPTPEDEPEDQPIELGQDRTAIGGFFGIDIDEIDDPFIGADARVYFNLNDIIPTMSVIFNPAFNYYFITDVNLIQFDANVLAIFDWDLPVDPYFGLGLVITRWADAAAADVSVTANPFILGAEFNVGANVGGFAQLRGTRHSFGQPGFLVSFTTFALMGGLHFRF